jgi:autotransporter-associated beta strand protein
MSASLCAQTVTESFTGSTAPGWVFGGVGYTPNLTSGTIDPANDGWLRLTSANTNLATSAHYDTAVSSDNRTVFTSFDFASYGGTGADGITFFLFDGSVTFDVGADGGSMGYAQKTGVDGLAGGYLAVSLDDFGNFSNGTEGREGGIGFNPNAVAVRGPGNGADGYEFIAATGDGTNPALTQQLDFIGGSRPDQTGTGYRRAEILLTATNQLAVWLQFGTSGPLAKVLETDLSGYLRPDTLKFGFTSGTGGSTGIHELRNLTVATLVANLWDNGANGGSSATGDWSVAQNWNPDVPATGDDILFDNTYVSTDQTVNVGTGQTRIVRSVSIDAPFSYTLNNGTLSFDDVGLPGFLGIAVTQTNGVASAGNTINSAIALQADATIRNATTSALNLGGNIALNGNTLRVDGTGNIASTGVISGTGDINKSQAGNLTLSGNNTYSGGTALSGGTITAADNNALGTGAVTMTGGTLAGSGAPVIANAVSLQGNAGISNLTLSNTLTQSGGDRTLTLAGATLGAVNLSQNNTGRTLTANVTTDSVVSGVIANGGTGAGGFTKTGAGTLTFNGANTYTGTNTINEGAIKLGASNRISDSSSLDLAGGTLQLNGFSERVNNLAFANGSLDFGPTGAANYFMFNNDGTVGGSLSVLNWEAGTDRLAYRSNQNVSATFLANIYFSGYGSGAEVLAGNQNQSISGYGGATDWDFITPSAVSFHTWNGRVDATNVTSADVNWTTAVNWIGDIAPASANSTRLAFGDNGTPGTRLASDMNGNFTVNAVRFNATNTLSYDLQGAGDTLSLRGTLPSIMQLSAVNQTLSMSTLSLNTATIFDVASSGNLTISAAITSNANTDTLVKEGNGSGVLILSGTNTFNSRLIINGGSAEATNAASLGTGNSSTGNTVVNDGGSLRLNNSGGGFTTTERLSLAGQGYGGAGALRNIDGNNTVSGTIALTADARIQSDLDTLTLSNTVSATNKNLSVGGAGNVTLSGAIATGTGTLTKDGAGTVTLSGTTANTYMGVTTVNAGTLVLDKSASGTTAVAGNLIIGDGTGADTVRLDESNQIADTASVTLNNGGVFNLNNNSETVAGLNAASSGAQVQLGGGTLTVNNSTANTYAGTLAGAGTLTKTGVGRLTLSTASGSFTGTTNVNNGIVALQSATALGSSAVSVQSGGNVELQGGLTYANAFTLRGDGTGANDGAVENFSGNNTMSGNITLATAARIGSSGGTLTLASAGTFTGTDRNVTFSGAGNTVVNRNINTGTGTLTKEGTGNLTLNNANSYTGATAINAGKITAGAAGIFGDTAALTVANTAVYDMAGFSETVGSLQGAGSVNFGGATLTLAAGASSFGGDFGFSNGTIVINAGQSLTLTAAIDAANINIILNGGTLFLGNGLAHTFGNLTVNTATTSVIDFGTSGATVAGFDNVFVNGTGRLNVNNWTDAVDYFISNNTTGAQGTAPNTRIVFAGGFTGADTKWLPYGGGGQLTPVPEPSAYGATLLASSAAFLLLRRRRRA